MGNCKATECVAICYSSEEKEYNFGLYIICVFFCRFPGHKICISGAEKEFHFQVFFTFNFLFQFIFLKKTLSK